MKIAITGAGGLVGSALTRRFMRDHEVIALSRRQLDIADRGAVLRFVAESRPQLIINCAVIGVDTCEADPALARAVNIDGPSALAEAASSIGAEIVHFSSNYVFDGTRDDHLYTIEDPAQPINAYGRTKLEGERAVQRLSERAHIVRTSWVFGAGKDSFLSTAYRNLKEGKRIQAIVDSRASCTFVEDLAARVDEIVQSRRYATWQIVNQGICSHQSFAMECARVLGLSPAAADKLIDCVREADLHRAAARPRSTPMRCLISEEMGFAPMPPWEDALARYVRH